MECNFFSHPSTISRSYGAGRARRDHRVYIVFLCALCERFNDQVKTILIKYTLSNEEARISQDKIASHLSPLQTSQGWENRNFRLFTKPSRLLVKKCSL